MAKTILVVAEARAGKLRQVSFEALGAASSCIEAGDTITALLIGSQIETLASELAAYGANQIIVIDHTDLEQYRPDAYVAAVQQAIEQIKPELIILGHTAIGRDLAPLIAASLSAGQLSDVVAIEKITDDLVFTRPLYAGKVFERVSFASTPCVLTIRPNNIPPLSQDSSLQAEVINLPYTVPTLHTIIRDVVKKASGAIDLSEAKIVISGGRGVKSADGFKPLEELASLLNGAVGASRGACDAGYCDYGMQIGQTGKVVTPEIYIACGISGAIQHLAGMSGSRVIIAINKDPEAPIFKVADYGIVGDLFEVVPLLTEEFRKVL
ncbi:electron transfer flavoprotein subunit alpha/FixB family protein [Paenibacillus sp. KN14-4R]|uniref:electron transfer flavoprotein subunit alpha/FixB family protein n=1 Tax=Paenibacillus sp. KN14-4R TaxID=3445773 RepID=UPI003F9FE95D